MVTSTAMTPPAMRASVSGITCSAAFALTTAMIPGFRSIDTISDFERM
jgi:hypothetical protein